MVKCRYNLQGTEKEPSRAIHKEKSIAARIMKNGKRTYALAVLLLCASGLSLIGAAPAAAGDMLNAIFDEFAKTLSVAVGAEFQVNQEEFYEFIHTDESKRQFSRDVLQPFLESLLTDGDAEAQARLNETSALFAREKLNEFFEANRGRGVAKSRV